MKHTPGPWNLLGPCKGKWDEEGDFAIQDSEGKIIAETYKTVGYDQIRPAEENACLIAAAPDLLEAAKKALDECVDLIATDAGKAIEAAIAKAEGKGS